MFLLIIFMLLVGLVEANLSKLTPLEFRRAAERAFPNDATKSAPIQFYGKIINTCDEVAGENCFRAVVASGRTDFTGEGGDLANIYVETNDYDTWRQNAVGMKQVEGEFIYQLQNSTLSCLTIQLHWWFGRNSSEEEPHVGCQAIMLAANWDCHLDWALTAECAWNIETEQAEALYTVVNLGPEEEPGNPSIVSLVKNNGGDVKTCVARRKN